MQPGDHMYKSWTKQLFTVILVMITTSSLLGGQTAPIAKEGIALAIVYDTSGSMREDVSNGKGGREAKYKIANRAIHAVIDRLATVAAPSDGTPKLPIEVALYAFKSDRCAVIKPMGIFDPDKMRSAVNTLNNPSGLTPLGLSLQMASLNLMDSSMSRKHVLVITDGINTTGSDPAQVFTVVKKQAANREQILSVHFIAFDVDAQVFSGMKKLGATVVGAGDEKQLNEQLKFILEKKILLEDEEPAATANKKS